MNELHVVVIVSQVPEFVCKQLRKTVINLFFFYLFACKSFVYLFGLHSLVILL